VHPVLEQLGDRVQIDGRAIRGGDELPQVVRLKVGLGIVIRQRGQALKPELDVRLALRQGWPG
jgi:hypothetical protein